MAAGNSKDFAQMKSETIFKIITFKIKINIKKILQISQLWVKNQILIGWKDTIIILRINVSPFKDSKPLQLM